MSHSIVSTPWQADFLVLPQAPLCYWLRPRFFELLSGRRLGDVADAVTGLQTSDDDGFVRFVWEVRPEEWAWPPRERRWVPFEKGVATVSGSANTGGQWTGRTMGPGSRPSRPAWSGTSSIT